MVFVFVLRRHMCVEDLPASSMFASRCTLITKRYLLDINYPSNKWNVQDLNYPRKYPRHCPDVSITRGLSSESTEVNLHWLEGPSAPLQLSVHFSTPTSTNIVIKQSGLIPKEGDINKRLIWVETATLRCPLVLIGWYKHWGLVNIVCSIAPRWLLLCDYQGEWLPSHCLHPTWQWILIV